jgi:hypothetical protein
MEHLVVGTRRLPFDGKALGWMHECDGAATGPKIREQLESYGYCLLRSALPRELVDAGAAALSDELASQGWLVEGTEPAELVVRREPPGSGMLREVEQDAMMSHSAIRRVLHGPELFGILEALFEEEPISFDYKWFRAVIPGQFSGFHMDNVYMGAGSARVHTVWLPWHDIDTTKGGLVVLEGSHSLPGYARMRETYGAQQHGQWFGTDPAELLAFEPQRARWVTSTFRAGDVVIFPMLTMHGSLTNRTRPAAPLGGRAFPALLRAARPQALRCAPQQLGSDRSCLQTPAAAAARPGCTGICERGCATIDVSREGGVGLGTHTPGLPAASDWGPERVHHQKPWRTPLMMVPS